MASPRGGVETSRILVTDDDAALRKMLVNKLQRAGYNVREACSGAETLTSLGSTHFRMLVLDLDMTESDGFQILKMVRTEHPGVHVLVISGYFNGALLEAAECLGATLSLDKTGAPRQLVKSVRKLLGDPV